MSDETSSILVSIGSITSRCSENEPAPLPRGGAKTGRERATENEPIVSTTEQSLQVSVIQMQKRWWKIKLFTTSQEMWNMYLITALEKKSKKYANYGVTIIRKRNRKYTLSIETKLNSQ